MIILSIIIALLVIFAVVVIIARVSNASKRKKSQANSQVYVGNLAYRVKDEDLREFFAKFGSIQDVRIVKNRQTGRSKGFGFVTFSDDPSAQAATEAHGELMSGRNLVVRIAKARD